LRYHPTELALRTADELTIVWSDGRSDSIPIRRLRDQCPCATCRERRGAAPAEPELLPILRREEMLPLRIESMRPVGNYAYSIRFSDGHDTGIFTLELLRELGAG
jgi:DUF971 family protein